MQIVGFLIFSFEGSNDRTHSESSHQPSKKATKMSGVYMGDLHGNGLVHFNEKRPGNTVSIIIYIIYISSRMIDPTNFLDTLLGQIHIYGKNAPFYVCGDFNSRTSNLEDFIPGIDDIPERHVVDFTSNKYGQHFCDFLIDANCCILNGRQNSIKNSYTFVSPVQGSSVVDYCVVPYEQLCNFDSFKVRSMCEMLEEFKLVKSISSTSSGSDHSLLTWEFRLKDDAQSHKTDKRDTRYTKTVKECYKRNIPNDFLNSKVDILESVINKLNDNVECQATIDNIYSDLELVIKSEMKDKLDFKVINIKWGSNNKRRRITKPWWSDNLTDLWNAVCETEKVYYHVVMKLSRETRNISLTLESSLTAKYKNQNDSFIENNKQI